MMSARLASRLQFVIEFLIYLLSALASYLDKSAPEISALLLHDVAVSLTFRIGIVHYSGILLVFMTFKPFHGSGDRLLNFFRRLID